jgi:energy-coupling factor transporter ATP-binding protein EcfA2
VIDGVPPPERLEELARELSALDLTLAPEAVPLRDRAVRLAGEYLVPRLRSPDAPRVVAVVGVSGVGKSTIVNALAGSEVTDAGDLRPTTTEPVAWGRELPATLDAVRRRLPGWFVRGDRPPPSGVVVIDTPPPDVAGPDGSPIAHAVLEAADACVLVVSASRYADAGGLELVERSRGRRLPVAVVVNRLPPDAPDSAGIVGDVEAAMRRFGAEDVASGGTHAVAEVGPGEAVPWSAVEALWDRIVMWGAADPPQAVAGSVSALVDALDGLRPLLVEAEMLRFESASIVTSTYERERDAFASEVTGGRFEGVEEAERRDALAVAITRHAGRAARRSAEHWAAVVPGLVERHPELYVASDGTHQRAFAAIDRWAAALDPAAGPDHGLDAVADEVLTIDAARFLGLLGEPPTDTVLELLDREALR